jgi:4-hydroxy-tetrahydrodipicolinate synthase
MTPPRGLSAFPITPTDSQGRVDVAGYGRLVDRLAGSGVASIGVLGSTGGYMYLTREERRRALETAVAAAAGRTPLIAGVGALRTDDAVQLAKDAAEAGASAGLLSAVSYTPLTQDEVFEHCVTVARESGLPIVLYDNPVATGFRFSPDLIARLAREPGFVGIKNPTESPDKTVAHLAEQRAATPTGFSIGYSGDWNCAEALIAGADAWYSVLAGVLPAPGGAIVRAVSQGDHAEARAVNAALAPVWALFRAHTGLRVVYAMARILGLADTAPPRPILPLSAEAVREVERVLKALPPAWLAETDQT